VVMHRGRLAYYRSEVVSAVFVCLTLQCGAFPCRPTLPAISCAAALVGACCRCVGQACKAGEAPMKNLYLVLGNYDIDPKVRPCGHGPAA
jgi:hypothetical protein